jgi:hypothetical protein
MKPGERNTAGVMAKRLSARIAAWTGRKTPSHGGKNRAAFLAVRDDVREAINDGWPVIAIWGTLYEEGKVSFSYETFRMYVNRLIRAKRLETELRRVAGKEEGRGKSDQASVRPVDHNSTAGIRGLTWNPIPNNDDLI